MSEQAMTEATVSITGLTKLDKMEMEGTPGVRFEEVPAPRGSHAELTLFTAYFAVTAVAALAAYLLRTTENESGDVTVEIHHPSGKIEKRIVKWDKSSAKAPQAEIIRQILGSGLSSAASGSSSNQQ